jgi:DNA-entry nuclease
MTALCLLLALAAGLALVLTRPIRARRAAALALALALLAGCSAPPPDAEPASDLTQEAASATAETADQTASSTEEEVPDAAAAASALSAFDYSQVPAYSGHASVPINHNQPFFTDADRTTASFETYSPLDRLGRCGPAYACLSTDTMPTEERGAINNVKPSGWQTVRYDGIDGKYLYNRCHLIAYELSGENANECNLITGTRYLNIEGMLPYENATAQHIRYYKDHVLYRVTPVFQGNELVARGVLIEAQGVEDPEYHLCVWCYNVQPGIAINYATGASSGPADATDSAQAVDTNGKTRPADGTTVYWTKNGSVYHTNANCKGLRNAKNIRSGPIELCPKNKQCSLCSG